VTHEHRRGLLLVAAAAAVWSLGGLVFRLIGTDVLTIMCGRALAAGFLLLTILALKTRGRPWTALAALGWPGFLVAVFFAADSTCYMAALHFTTVAHVVVMLSLTPLFAALAAWVVMREAIRLPVAIAMFLAFAGVALMVSDNYASGAWIGDFLALGVPTLFAVVTVITRRYPGVDLLPSVCLAAILSGLVFLPFAHFAGATATDLGLMTFLGSIEFGLGLLLYLAGAKLLPSAEATLMSLLETVLAPLWVWLAVAEDPGWRAIIGGLVVLAALAGLALSDMRRGAAV
jgi:drug/metabolite transporter (DMT)-like permease